MTSLANTIRVPHKATLEKPRRGGLPKNALYLNGIGEVCFIDDRDGPEYCFAGGGGSAAEILLQNGPFAGVAPAGSKIGVDQTGGQIYHNVGGTWTALSSGGQDEVVLSTTDLTGAAPAGAKYGVNTTSQQTFYVNGAGQWTASLGATSPVVVNPGVLAGPAPAGATLGVDRNSGQKYYVDGGGSWQPIPTDDEVVLNAGPLAGAAPTGAKYGVDTVNDASYKVVAGNWALIPSTAAEQEVVTSTTDLTGAAPAGAEFGVNTTSGSRFYVNGAGQWTPVASGTAPSEVIVSTTPLVGVAPAGAQHGIDLTTNQEYFVVAGNWVERGTDDFVVSPAAALTGAAPSQAEYGINLATGIRYYVDGAGQWQPIPFQDEIETFTVNPVIGSNAPVGVHFGLNTLTGDEFYVDSNGDWRAKTPGASLTRSFTQAGHGLNMGDRVYMDAAGNWVVGDSTGVGEKIPVAVVTETPDANTVVLQGIKGVWVDLTDAQLFGGPWDITNGGAATNSRYAFTQDDGTLGHDQDAEINNAEFYRVDGDSVLTLGGRPYANSVTPQGLTVNTVAELVTQLPKPTGTVFTVVNDPTNANNGLHLVVGAVGTSTSTTIQI